MHDDCTHSVEDSAENSVPPLHAIRPPPAVRASEVPALSKREPCPCGSARTSAVLPPAFALFTRPPQAYDAEVKRARTVLHTPPSPQSRAVDARRPDPRILLHARHE